MKALVFDMDGTIADLYGVKDWLKSLQNESSEPYRIAQPLYDMDTLNVILTLLQMDGWKIIVTTWLAKNSTPAYDNKVRKAKRRWLEKMNFPFDELHMVKYGTPKQNVTRKLGGFQILVDDNEDVRNAWNLGGTINANKDILKALVGLL